VIGPTPVQDASTRIVVSLQPIWLNVLVEGARGRGIPLADTCAVFSREGHPERDPVVTSAKMSVAPVKLP